MFPQVQRSDETPPLVAGLKGNEDLLMPSGTTPQRRELVYPKELMKLQSRCELLETLRKQQEALQAALQEEQEDEDVEDSLEDELSTCNESVDTEPSFVDENLVFNENKRVPFFKVSDVYSFWSSSLGQNLVPDLKQISAFSCKFSF